MGHLVSTATWATDIYGVIAGTFSDHILPSENHVLWKAETLFYDYFHIQFAVVGVVIFFIISGYLLVLGQEKFQQRKIISLEFIGSKILRIYPALILCVVCNGVLVYFSQGIRFLPQEYLATATLTFGFTHFSSTMGVLWYLQVLMCFYLVFAVIQRFDMGKVLVFYAFIVGVIFLGLKTQNFYILTAAWLFRYASVILIGVIFGLCKDMPKKKCLLYTGSGVVLTHGVLRLYQELFGDESTYTNINTLLFAVLIVLGLMWFVNDNIKLYKPIETTINFIASLSLEFYLLHVHFGLTTMYYLSKMELSPYLTLLGGVSVSIVVAWVVHITVNFCIINFKKSFAKGDSI